MKQGKLYLGSSAASRISHNIAKESPMLPLRTRNADSKSKKQQQQDNENFSVESDVRLTRLQPRPVSVQTFQPVDEKNPDHLENRNSIYSVSPNNPHGYRDSSLTRTSIEYTDTYISSSLKHHKNSSDKTHMLPAAPPKPPRDQGQLV